MNFFHLDSNILETLDEDLFVNTPALTNLTFSNNKLTSFSHKTFTPIQSTLRYIDMSENPIQCTCEIRWLFTWRKSSLQIGRANRTKCSFTSLPLFRGKLVFKVDPQKLCASNIILYCTLPFVIVALVITFAALYYKRQCISYNTFLLKLAFLVYRGRQNPPGPDDYEFHLNVFFIADDKEWAKDHLRPNMQESLPHFDRIAFGDDDLPLGMYYLDAVLYLIKHSFKTILLLSRAATRDQEFMMKVRTALNHVTNTRTQYTMLVLLEDIADEDLPHIVKLYLSEERPHIRWVQEVRAQKYFWKKLVTRLTVNMPQNVQCK